MDSSELITGAVLQHESGNFYQVLAKTKIKVLGGWKCWVNGVIYFRVKREDGNFFSVDRDNEQLYSRPVTGFGDKWKLIRKAPAMNY